MRTNSLIPIGWVVPGRIAPGNRLRELIDGRIGENFSRRVRRTPRSRRLALPMKDGRSAHVPRVIEPASITERCAVFVFRERDDQRRSKRQENRQCKSRPGLPALAVFLSLASPLVIE